MPSFDLTDSIHGIHHRLSAALKERRTLPHPGIAGDEGELLWLRVLEQHLPRRYAIRRGIVIDSRGGRSDAIDLIVYDPQYTPVFLAQDEHAYVFAEAVYAVFEVKTEIGSREFEYAGQKAASVRRLHRTNGEIPHAGGLISNPRPLFPIVAGLLAGSHRWSEPEAKFKEYGGSLEGDCRLDFALALKSPDDDSCGIFWQRGENTESSEIPRTSLIELGPSTFVQFLYALLDRLQSLGTAPAVDWQEYIACTRESVPRGRRS